MDFVYRIIRRFPPALSGIWYGIRHDFSVRSQFIGGSLVVLFTLFAGLPHTTTELLLLLLAWSLVLITELQNSAIEAALDLLHPERHPEIQKSKDMAAGAVLLSGAFFALTVGIVLYT